MTVPLLLWPAKEPEMEELVKVEIEVTPRAAAALKDWRRRKRIGEVVSRMVAPRGDADDPLAAVLRETQQAARAAGLTDEDVDCELAAYNAEHRS
jgi:hypothetical protein